MYISTLAIPLRQAYQHQEQDSVELLLQDRAQIWQHVRAWSASVPQRNRIIVAGEFNTPLKTSRPHVGPGITTHSSAQQKDQRVFQGLLQGLGLVAANTWGRAGPASTNFVNHRNQSVQIDFVLLRQPCNVPALQTTILKDSLLVSDTGMRHYPIRLCIPNDSQ